MSDAWEGIVHCTVCYFNISFRFFFILDIFSVISFSLKRWQEFYFQQVKKKKPLKQHLDHRITPGLEIEPGLDAEEQILMYKHSDTHTLTRFWLAHRAAREWIYPDFQAFVPFFSACFSLSRQLHHDPWYWSHGCPGGLKGPQCCYGTHGPSVLTLMSYLSARFLFWFAHGKCMPVLNYNFFNAVVIYMDGLWRPPTPLT